MVTSDVSPPNLHLIFSGKFTLTEFARSKLADKVGKSTRNYEGQTIWYTTPSGSAVFVAGVNYWACELSYTCAEGNTNVKTRNILQSVTEQVLNLWQQKGVGKTLH